MKEKQVILAYLLGIVMTLLGLQLACAAQHKEKPGGTSLSARQVGSLNQ